MDTVFLGGKEKQSILLEEFRFCFEIFIFISVEFKKKIKQLKGKKSKKIKTIEAKITKRHNSRKKVKVCERIRNHGKCFSKLNGNSIEKKTQAEEKKNITLE